MFGSFSAHFAINFIIFRLLQIAIDGELLL